MVAEPPPGPQGASGNTRARFEQWAQNPTCQANTISAVHNVRMADVAIREGYKPTFGQSPFALALGQTFERSLLWNDAERLLGELIRHGEHSADRYAKRLGYAFELVEYLDVYERPLDGATPFRRGRSHPFAGQRIGRLVR